MASLRFRLGLTLHKARQEAHENLTLGRMTGVLERKELLVGKRPTDFLCVGPSFEEKPNDIVLIIPGNPGVTGYYTSFMETIYMTLKGTHAVWAVSHAGHCCTSYTKSQLGKDVYDLNDQLRHKIDFIHDFVPKGAKVTLVGHSIGCQIILSVLQAFEDSTDINIKYSYLLFPTIERMKDSPNGTRLWPVLCYFRWLTIFLAIIASFIPKKIKESLLYIYFGRKAHKHVIKASIELLNPKIIQNVLWMAYSELNEVLMPNLKALEKHKGKVMLYYGANDGWCPLSYHQDLIAKVKEVNAQVCQEGHAHAFVLKSSEPMGEKVAHWIS